MSVVTISGQAGAGDEVVASRVADALGYRLIDRPVVLKVLEQYGIVEYEQLLDTPPHLFDGLGSEKQSANDLLNRLYLLFAKRNNVVIVSRRAYISLEPFLNSFAVFLKAPHNVRVRNVMKWEELSQAEAEK
ncbi:MAG: AAA family ATPase, partial [Spirochaetota bacterium]